MAYDFSKPVQAVGKYVCLRTIDIADDIKTKSGMFGISRYGDNGRLGKYEVISVGSIAKEKYGLEPHMIVLADRLAAKGWRGEYPIIEYNSIIFSISQCGTRVPMKGQYLVKSLEKNDYEVNVNGLYVPSKETVPLGKVIAVNEAGSVAPGDLVVLTKGADQILSGDGTYLIYKNEMTVARYED